MINLLLINLKLDLEDLINFSYSKIYWWKNLNFWIKFWYFLLLISTILIFYYLLILSFYISKYLFKYNFIILDFVSNQLNFKLYSNYVYLYYLLSVYLWLKIIINKFFFYLPLLIIKLLNLIFNFFFIKYWIIHYITNLKKFLDKKLYNLYLSIEYVFKFSYIFKWKKIIEQYLYIYIKYIRIYNLIIMEKTIKIRKIIYLYFLYLCNIKRSIFWLYIIIIYSNLFFTSIYCTLYFLVIIAPINLYLFIDYYIYLNYTMYLLNRLEWNHVKFYFYKLFYSFIKFFFNNIILYFFLLSFIIFFEFIKYLFEYLLSWLVYLIKVNFFNWIYFLYLTQYKGCRVIMDIAFQFDTLFKLHFFKHNEYEANMNYYFYLHCLIGNYKYFYFSIIQYKFFNNIRFTNIFKSFFNHLK